ncbi:hypothetical protein D3C87_1104800 [compost metagenome]
MNEEVISLIVDDEYILLNEYISQVIVDLTDHRYIMHCNSNKMYDFLINYIKDKSTVSAKFILKCISEEFRISNSLRLIKHVFDKNIVQYNVINSMDDQNLIGHSSYDIFKYFIEHDKVNNIYLPDHIMSKRKLLTCIDNIHKVKDWNMISYYSKYHRYHDIEGIQLMEEAIINSSSPFDIIDHCYPSSCINRLLHKFKVKVCDSTSNFIDVLLEGNTIALKYLYTNKFKVVHEDISIIFEKYSSLRSDTNIRMILEVFDINVTNEMFQRLIDCEDFIESVKYILETNRFILLNEWHIKDILCINDTDLTELAINSVNQDILDKIEINDLIDINQLRYFNFEFFIPDKIMYDPFIYYMAFKDNKQFDIHIDDSFILKDLLRRDLYRDIISCSSYKKDKFDIVQYIMKM